MTTTDIESVTAEEILDGRLEPTLRVTIRTTEGTVGRADVPCGRSRGGAEAIDLRDGTARYRGKGVRDAIQNIENEIASTVQGMAVTEQRAIDDALVELDGTDDKSNLGGNSLTGVSLAVLKAGAAAAELPLYQYFGGSTSHILPIPVFDMIEGGKLAGTDFAFQEHQLLPVGVDSFSEAIRLCAEVYYELGGIVEDRWGKGARNVGYEGGYTPTGVSDPREAFDAELAAVEELGYGDEFVLGLDVAATHFYDPESAEYELMDRTMSRDELIEFYEELVAAYPLRSIEDPFHEDDFEGFAELTETVDVQIIGDDLFVTNTDRLEWGINERAANALLLKVNQVGTVSEALDAAEMAVRNGYAVQVSERSGQTPDTWLADLTVGVGAGQIKTGVTRGERTEQYNRLLEIEERSDTAVYADWPNGA
jgi:enolase